MSHSFALAILLYASRVITMGRLVQSAAWPMLQHRPKPWMIPNTYTCGAPDTVPSQDTVIFCGDPIPIGRYYRSSSPPTSFQLLATGIVGTVWSRKGGALLCIGSASYQIHLSTRSQLHVKSILVLNWCIQITINIYVYSRTWEVLEFTLQYVLRFVL